MREFETILISNFFQSKNCINICYFRNDYLSTYTLTGVLLSFSRCIPRELIVAIVFVPRGG